MKTLQTTSSELAPADAREALLDYIKLRLMVNGYDGLGDASAAERLHVPFEVIAHLKERIRLAYGQHSPLETRVQSFIDLYLADVATEDHVRIPGLGQTFVLDRARMALELSLPENGDKFESDIVSSFRLQNGQGVLHNPKSDRRTTQGVFHVAEGGLPIPEDKTAVAKSVFAKLLKIALAPPKELMRLPFTSGNQVPFETQVTLMMRPLVVPEVSGILGEKRMETQYVVPGNLTSNLDFLERIFGNAGDPYLPINDAGLDINGWTGHTGYVVLAPHLITVTKKSLGLPNIADATERQVRDGQCWKSDSELYNGGNAFKLTARDTAGVIVTIIADNYYGYCKKEVKTQMSYAANLLGMVEEEHAGGAIVYPGYDLGKYFSVATHLPATNYSFRTVKELIAGQIEMKPEGYAVNKKFPDVLYVPENVEIDIYKQTASWTNLSGKHSLTLDPNQTYIVPSGFKVRLQQEKGSNQWRLIGVAGEGTYCHKPSTVSGGGKSEISKAISDQIMYGPFYITDFDKDMDTVQELLEHDYSERFRVPRKPESRPILSPKRSLGSVIKLLTPSATLYTDEYNAWLESIPHAIRQLVYVVKRFYRQEHGDDWRAQFSVNMVNGRPGNELRYNGEKLLTYYMRVGFTPDGSWRIFSLRNDYVPAAKLQQEDDITVSVVIPADLLSHLNPRYSGQFSYKLVSRENPERRLFQRPDDAIHRGFDKITERDFAQPDNFFSNFEPLVQEQAKEIVAAPITFGQFTPPMQAVIKKAAEVPGFFVSSAHPRIVDGKPSKNPRYLQIRPDISDPKGTYLAEIGARLHRSLKTGEPLYNPVNAILPGRRLNPPDAAAGIRSLAVYSPIHYQETPELFMENISSLTGKSPSTTGAGSEGALTKGPFNALPPIVDLNNALVAHIITGAETFVTAAGYVGPNFRVDHDISLLIPEVWSRMEVHERDPKYLIENNYLEPCPEEVGGIKVEASRLGFRITAHFVSAFFGIIFDNPNDLFTPEMLRPELQGVESFVDGVNNIVSTQKRIAENYFLDGSVEMACPPLAALLHVMRDGQWQGLKSTDPGFRELFTRDSMMKSAWYEERLRTQQMVDQHLWQRHVAYLESLLSSGNQRGSQHADMLAKRLSEAKAMLARVSEPSYAVSLRGFIGADPALRA